ncbi:hypothetical protein FQA39_LY09022 [Lamprigera yunnana]|nr:hypothetical protein FQA39_LY09022 [Lamprigera yunnana]
MLVILLLGAFMVFIYSYIIKPMHYWKNKNVVHKKPLPLFGNMLPLVLKQYNNTTLLRNIYEEFPNERYVGMYFFRSPALLIRDPDLIKRIMVKEFDTFADHLDLVPKGVDPLWSKNLFAMEGGEEWHDLRSTLSPSFTSSKMKAMFVLMKECSRQFINHFLKQGNSIEVELKDCFARFATDVIATTAFGVTCDSLSDQNNEFYLMAQDVSNFKGVKGILFLLNFLSPTLARVSTFMIKFD